MKGSVIGFCTENTEVQTAQVNQPEVIQPRKSLVQIHFSERNMTLAYYNDRFDLHVGDVVYVDGKMEGLRGRVTEVSYTFKIKLSDYKRVIGLVDTKVEGQLLFAGSHCVSFDSNTIPYEKIRTWYKAPSPAEEYASGDEGNMLPLYDLDKLHVSSAIGDRGIEYYKNNRVIYVEINGTRGRAIVQGTKPYELEFTYKDGMYGGLVCECFSAAACKHQVAMLLQLRETIDFIRDNYADEYAKTSYFAAISKFNLFRDAIDGMCKGKIVIEKTE